MSKELKRPHYKGFISNDAFIYALNEYIDQLESKLKKADEQNEEVAIKFLKWSDANIERINEYGWSYESAWNEFLNQQDNE